MSTIATIDIGGSAVPRLAFGLGSLMKWAPNHAYPLPTDSTTEIRQAIAAGFRHFNTGDLYTNNPSAAEVFQSCGLSREEFFFSVKLNTYALLGCKGRESIIDSAKKEIERFGMEGYVDLLQLHFPPRGYPGNLSNQEAWKVLEDLKDQGIARVIGVSNWSLKDYDDIFRMEDLRHEPQVNEWEFNPFLLFDPKFRELHFFELKHGIVNMNYGLLTAISGKISADQTANLQAKLQSLSAEIGLNPSELLLRWAYDGPCRILVTSTSKAERATSLISLLAEQRTELPRYVSRGIEEAAEADGYEGKIFYSHSHMEQGSAHPV